MSDANHDRLSIDSVRDGIAAAGATWQAEENEFWNLSDSMKRLKLGAVPPGTTMAAREELGRRLAAAAAPTGALFPAVHDWRSASGQNYVTPIRDQGACGSCVAFGTSAAVEVTARVLFGPGLDVDVSEAQLFYCAGAADGASCSTGWWPDHAFPAFERGGITDEGHYPYSGGDQKCGVRAGWQDTATKVTAWHTIADAADIKIWLSTRGAVSACFSVYRDFYSYAGGVYRHTSGDLLGGHCVAIVGYDEPNKSWICKNSWGTGFGESGFFRIGYGECGIDAEVWAVDGVTLRSPGTVPLYRYWNGGISDHFYTTNWSELGAGRYGWEFEETQCYVFPSQVAGSVPLHRYWNGSAGDHFYTTNWNELGAGKSGYVYEGVQCYVFPNLGVKNTALYRYWSPGGSDHFYTTNFDELGQGNYGWHLESVQGFVPAGPGAVAASRTAVEAPSSFRPGLPVSASPTGGERPDTFITVDIPEPEPALL
jgi:hypothetical protein